MPMYNILCEDCQLDKDEFATYSEFCEHNNKETAIICPKCGNKTAFYSLTHLKSNLIPVYKDVMNFYSPSTQERWYRGFEGLSKR